MAINFRERFLESLTDSACEIMKKQASGIPITDNESIFMSMYINELDKYESVPLSDKFINSIKEFGKLIKDNMGTIKNFINSGTQQSVDDYEINTDLNGGE